MLVWSVQGVIYCFNENNSQYLKIWIWIHCSTHGFSPWKCRIGRRADRSVLTCPQQNCSSKFSNSKKNNLYLDNIIWRPSLCLWTVARDTAIIIIRKIYEKTERESIKSIRFQFTIPIKMQMNMNSIWCLTWLG